MAQHQQHVRQQPHHVRNQTYTEKFKHMLQRIRTTPGQSMTTILIILLLIVLVIVAVHYFRLYTFPFLGFIPQQKAPAPASHLQYFFF